MLTVDRKIIKESWST